MRWYNQNTLTVGTIHYLNSFQRLQNCSAKFYNGEGNIYVLDYLSHIFIIVSIFIAFFYFSYKYWTEVVNRVGNPKVGKVTSTLFSFYSQMSGFTYERNFFIFWGKYLLCFVAFNSQFFTIDCIPNRFFKLKQRPQVGHTSLKHELA